MWNEMTALFRDYMGSGLVMILFLLAEIYLFAREKRKKVRILFVYVPILLLCLFFCPPFAKLIYTFADSEVYYRILWLVPVTSVIAYTAVDIYVSLSGKKKWCFVASAAVLIMVSGSFIYASPLFSPAKNIYHMPEEVVEICDAIEVEGREVRAVFPAEMLQYVRQYSPVVCMPYGREILVSRWGNHDDLYDLMESEEIDVEALCNLSRARECHYIVLNREKKCNGSFADYDYTLFTQVAEYDVYKDATVSLEL